MNNKKIQLTKLQKEIMKEFYSIPVTKVIYNKSERKSIWEKAKSKTLNLKKDITVLEEQCPALAHQIKKSYKCNGNIQSAVFSECVYAQTFANMLKLKNFINCCEQPKFIPSNILNLLNSYNLVPRYVYSDAKKKRMLIQAGSCGGIDSALITVIDLTIYTIEFKEPGAKTSEPDLPKYKENGKLLVNKEFLQNYSQFKYMLKEQKGLNFFKSMGHNINNFSEESINIAVTNNYVKKYADVVCTEDSDGNLVMLPINQISKWAKLQGEIRPAGRNHYKVWTPKFLKTFLCKHKAIFSGNIVTISNLEERKERGGNGKVSGYKINPLFFIYKKDCNIVNNLISFDISKVRQLNPTIAAKMFFLNIKHKNIYDYYKDFL
ncbi:MAG: hypothetical protein ACI4N3_02375 [Alphaproteobacteria bacterium]